MMRRTKPALAVAVAGIVLLALVACSEKSSAPATQPVTEPGTTPATQPSAAAAPAATPDAGSSADLVAEGRSVYVGNCTACHNTDPTLPGALGPALAGSSRALVEARVMRAEYPPGYKPKRDTKAMIPMPFLEKKIPALAAYLESVPPRS